MIGLKEGQRLERHTCGVLFKCVLLCSNNFDMFKMIYNDSFEETEETCIRHTIASQWPSERIPLQAVRGAGMVKLPLRCFKKVEAVEDEANAIECDQI